MTTSETEPEARAEEAAMIEGAYRALAAGDPDSISVAEILRHAGLSTRAFYRHFRSKDDLILAMFRSDSALVLGRLEAAVAAAPDCVAALAAWVDELLAVGYQPHRSQRVRLLSSAAARNATGYSAAYDEMMTAQRDVLVGILERGRADGSLPLARADDALAIQAVVSRFLEDASLGTARLTRTEARAQTLDFVHRALGVDRVGEAPV